MAAEHNTDNQGNPIDENGKLILESIVIIDEITDEDFLDENGVRKKERQAIEEGGLILTLESAAAVTHNSLSSDGKGTTNISNDQTNSQEHSENTQNSENMRFSVTSAECAE